MINQQLQSFAEAWNQHKLQICDGPNRLPADVFGFDMMVHGVHGDQLPEEVITEEEMEVYGVDWEGLNHDRLLQSQRENNHIQEGLSSWIGQTGPPQHLNEVPVYTPSSDALTSEELLGFSDAVRPWYGLPDNKSKLIVWSQGLGYARAV